MTIHFISSTDDLKHYDQWVRAHPHGSLWQSCEWKRFQEAVGREVRIYTEENNGNIVSSALVVIDRTALGFSSWDIPRGPLWKSQIPNSKSQPLQELLNRIFRDAKKDHCFSIYISPPFNLFSVARIRLSALRAAIDESPLRVDQSFLSYKLQASRRHEQPAATRIIDLTQSQENILAQMKPKGRYNIRVAEKHGIEVEASTDVDAFYALLRETGERDRFKTLPKKHYKAFLENLEGSFLLLASQSSPPLYPPPKKGGVLPLYPPPKGGVPSKAIAGLIGVLWGSKAYYYYGASSYAERATMSPYLLQWEAMKTCKALGCTTYDLLGIVPDSKCHPWTGVSAFKEKFGGDVVTYPPEQEIVLRPIIKTLLTFKRKLIK